MLGDVEYLLLRDVEGSEHRDLEGSVLWEGSVFGNVEVSIHRGVEG
jgi:hypothetical protein